MRCGYENYVVSTQGVKIVVIFKDLCEFAAEEVNQRALTFSIVNLRGSNAEKDPFKRRVIRAVQQAYLEIVQYSHHWQFLDKRGLLLTLRAGVNEYLLANVQSLEWDSLYLTEEDSTTRWPVYESSYNLWQDRERYENTANSIPLELSRTNDPDKWVFWPVPNRKYFLNGNLRLKPIELKLVTDQPCWDEEFHEMVAWRAVIILESRVATTDEIVSKLNANSAQRMFNIRWSAFCHQYLPSLIGASALL